MGITKVAVIGIGNIGSAHAECIMSKKIDGMELTEVCDIEIEKLKKFKNNENITTYTDYRQMLNSCLADTTCRNCRGSIKKRKKCFG